MGHLVPSLDLLKRHLPSYLSISTRSSFSSGHLELGHITLTRLPACSCSSWWRAWASWFTVWGGKKERKVKKAQG